ncbi:MULTISPECIES: hypothetical protein [unclassified Bradyrhizobium]|uniref:hypothetical protein n=1 Tax=unclassified Bradyrhizobium TaxID=2631580 RepID=UPI0024B20552|nr:hypothetical protein [Bradyrhizobium sp. CB2312]WFU75216.1 hypothetical protein QA642_14915 [Bradyrhizobium sp. CB2312]
MNRRTVLALGLLSAAFACAGPQMGLAQSDLLIGTWRLNVEKSKFSPGPPPKSQTLNFQRVGQDLQNTAETIDAQGHASKIVFMHIYDGKPHPTTGNPLFDATTYTSVDDHHVKWVRSKAEKPIQTGSNEISPDGKTFTVTTEGTGANGQPISSVAIYERQ